MGKLRLKASNESLSKITRRLLDIFEAISGERKNAQGWV